MIDPEAHFRALREGLALEARAAAERDRLGSARLDDGALERSGLGLARLDTKESEPTLGGRQLVHLGRARGAEILPPHRLTPGSPVRIRGHPEGPGIAGVVVRRTPTRLVVAVDAEVDLGDTEVRVEPSPDEVTPKRIAVDLERAERAGGRVGELRSVLLGRRPAEFDPPSTARLPDALDPHQEAAVRHALGARDVALLHGPPGTGKTRTLAALVRAAVGEGAKVLALAPSHTAVDNLALRLNGHGLDMVRLGHPARVSSELEEHTLDARLERHEDVRRARKWMREAAELFRRADRFTRARPEKGERAANRAAARALRADARALEASASERVLDGAQVVLATLGVDPEELGPRRFDLVVVDEAGQATEASSWRAVVRGDRLVLAGDHLQLPPTVISREAVALGFAYSLFERLMGLDAALGRRLDRQYRMHRAIMGFPNEEMYGGGLEADAAVAEHLIAELPGVRRPIAPLVFVDASGAGLEERAGPDGDSRCNPGEVDVLLAELRRWLEAGVDASSIGVITPYAAQVRLIEDRLGELPVEVDTVDGFQGREKEGILVSLVRSNADGEVGFLAEHRRMNVALTRARRALWVIGDGATLGSDPFYARLIAYAERVGGYRSVWE